MKIPLVGQSYEAFSPAVSVQETRNLFPEVIQDPNERDKNIAYLTQIPGRIVFKALTIIDSAATPVRGIWSGGGRLFVAAGTKYFELDSAGALVGSVRTIADDANHSPVQFFVNGTQLFIVSAGTAYVDNGLGPTAITNGAFAGFVTTYTSGAEFVVTWVSGDKFSPSFVGLTITIDGNARTVLNYINDETLLLSAALVVTNKAYSITPTVSALTGAYLNGYFLYNRTGSREIYYSPLNDGTAGGTFAWSGLDFFSKESYPDNVRSILAPGDGFLYVFGTESMEVWTGNQGSDAGNRPFVRVDGALHRYGSMSSWGPASIDGKVYFLGSDQQGWICAYVLDGFNPRRISTHAEESTWNDGNVPTNVTTYTYLENGHSFWVMQIAAQCWAYDGTLGEGLYPWHQRSAWSGSAFTQYPTYYHTFIAEFGSGKHITGGRLDGILYESSVRLFGDNGADIAWQRTLPYIYNEGKRLYFGRMELEMQTGTVASGSPPTVSMTYSDDRGQTFSTAQTASIGVHNDYSLCVWWPPQGSAYGRNFRLFGAGQSKICMTNLLCEITKGRV